MKRETIEVYADRLLSGHEIKLSNETLREFRECPKEDLIRYHHSLGRAIRNAFGLHQIPWKPKIDKDGVDVSKDHPDAVSMAIIEAAHKKL